MSANDKQVGGAHYKAKNGGVQHWDYSVVANVPNLEYAASKYVTRWRGKNGRQDLEKSLHFLEKRIESYRSGIGILRGANRRDGLFNRFIEDNGIPARERTIIDFIMHWKRIDQLEDAYVMIKKLIEELDAEEAGPTSAYVNQG